MRRRSRVIAPTGANQMPANDTDHAAECPPTLAARRRQPAHQIVLRLRLHRLRHQGQRLPDHPAAVLQPGHASAAGSVAGILFAALCIDALFDPIIGQFSDNLRIALGPAPSAHLSLGVAGRGELSPPVESAALEPGRAADLSLRRRRHRAHLHQLLRNSELRAEPRTHGQLRPAHRAIELSRLLRLDGRHDDVPAGAGGLPAAGCDAQGRAAQRDRAIRITACSPRF